MFGLKKKIEPRKGTIEKEISYIMAVPKDKEEISNIKKIIDRLKESSLFKFKSAEMRNNLVVQIEYKGEQYEIELISEKFNLSDLYTINHHLTQENYDALMNSEFGLTAAMKFGKSAIDSYHLQLKVLYCIIPSMVGLIDFSAEKILSGVWVKITAESSIPPSPDYIYCVQAITDYDDIVWLHTHGLNRCGSIEIEILKSDKENYNNHYSILQTMAKRAISNNGLEAEKEDFLIGYTNNGQPIVGTWIYWAEAIKLYNKNLLGGIKDRKETHNKNTGGIYLYLSPKDRDNKKYTHISAINEELPNNSLMMITVEETLRMSKLARERIEYFKNAIKNKEVHGLMKIGLLVDDEYQNEEKNNKEHIWFETLEIDGAKVKAILTQEAYYIKNLKVNSEMILDLEDITDWIIYTPENQITPDSVYLLEE